MSNVMLTVNNKQFALSEVPKWRSKVQVLCLTCNIVSPPCQQIFPMSCIKVSYHQLAMIHQCQDDRVRLCCHYLHHINHGMHKPRPC